MKTIKVKLDEKTIEISKLPLGRYAELLKSIKELPKHISGMDKMSPDQMLEKLPQLVGESMPDFVKIITIATSLEETEIVALGLDEVVRIVVAIIEVNNYAEVFATVKKAMAQAKA